MAYTHNAPSKTGKVFMSRSLSRIWWPTLLTQSHASYTHRGNWHNDFFCVTSFAYNTRYNVRHIPAKDRQVQLSSDGARLSLRGSAGAKEKEPRTPTPKEKQAATQEQPLVRFGLGLANWSERWFPDPLIFALLGIVVVFVVGLLLRQSPAKLAIQGGKNFWSLVPFTMQMVMIII